MADPSQILAPRASLLDYQKLQREFDMQKALTGAQIKKLSMVDVDQLGEQAFMKAAQGLELTPQELAAAKFLDAKSGGIQFDPVTGAVVQKPRISDKIGLGGLPASGGMAAPAGAGMQLPMSNRKSGGAMDYADLDAELAALGTPQNMGGNQQQADQWEQVYQAQMQAAAGNPKLQQQITTDYMKSRLAPNESEAKAAGFSDRISSANPLIDQYGEASTNPVDQVLSKVPLVGNYMVSDEYQMGDQARRDFVNAQLRRESGAVIADSEFANAEKQYLPARGDSKETLKQKAAARKIALDNMRFSAGPSYKAPKEAPKATGEITAEDIAEYKRLRGIK
ncbi:MAG: hypothetical protein WC091_02715 [Sulfuricellaceae bacterium]